MFKNRDLSPDAKLKFPDFLGFFFGAGTNMTGFMVSAFLLVYYSNVLYLGLTEVSLLMAVSKVFDGFSDLLMGRIIDKTKSRYGKARPWYARMIIPTAVSTILLFWMPAGLSQNWKYVYIFITYNLVLTICFTANAVAHASMIGLMTLNTKSRGIVGVMSMIANTIFTVLVTNFFLKLCKFYGNGNAYTQKSFTLTVVTYVGIYAVCAFLAFLITRERINNTEKTVGGDAIPAENKDTGDVPVRVALKSLVTNKYWILCILMCLGFYFLMSFASSATVYFAQYILNDIGMQGTLTTLLYVVIIVGIICALPVMNKFGKRFMMVVGLLISAFGWFMPQISLDKSFVTAASAVVGFGFGCIAAPAGSFLQDTLTYGTWKSGVSAIGMGNAVFSFVNKLSSALGMVVLGVVLDFGKFDASLKVQPNSAIGAIKALYIWIPTIICLLCLALSYFYDLDKKLPKIEEDIISGKIGELRSEL